MTGRKLLYLWGNRGMSGRSYCMRDRIYMYVAPSIFSFPSHWNGKEWKSKTLSLNALLLLLHFSPVYFFFRKIERKRRVMIIIDWGWTALNKLIFSFLSFRRWRRYINFLIGGDQSHHLRFLLFMSSYYILLLYNIVAICLYQKQVVIDDSTWRRIEAFRTLFYWGFALFFQGAFVAMVIYFSDCHTWSNMLISAISCTALSKQTSHNHRSLTPLV